MKRIIYILILITSTSLSLLAQHHAVEIRNAEIIRSGNDVMVKFEAVSPVFSSGYSVTLNPVIYNGEGDWKKLESIRLTGKKRNLSETRAGDTSIKRVVMNRKNNEPVGYEFTFPYEEWMQYISLSVEQISAGCCNQQAYPMEAIVENKLLHYNLLPQFDRRVLFYELTELEKYSLDNPFLHQSEDYHKRYDILKYERAQGTSALIFQTASHRIDPNVPGNRRVLESISKAFELIEKDPNAILKKIVIAGYASPEGTLAYNTALAQRRAESVKTYVKTLMRNLGDDLFEVYNGREDWDGLREFIANSNMEWKHEAIQIIDNYSMEHEIRKTKLKQLRGGAAYKYMLETFFPSLRSAGYIQVYYDIERQATSAKVFTDEQGRTVWIDPESPQNRIVTAVNKALELMLEQRFNEALSLLLPYSDDPRSWNNLGVCYMMTDNFDQAGNYFQKAIDVKDPNAPKNLEQIQWAKKLK